MQNEGIYCLDEWQKDRMRHGGGRVNSLGGCFNELISHLSRMKREKKIALRCFRALITYQTIQY